LRHGKASRCPRAPQKYDADNDDPHEEGEPRDDPDRPKGSAVEFSAEAIEPPKAIPMPMGMHAQASTRWSVLADSAATPIPSRKIAIGTPVLARKKEWNESGAHAAGVSP